MIALIVLLLPIFVSFVAPGVQRKCVGQVILLIGESDSTTKPRNAFIENLRSLLYSFDRDVKPQFVVTHPAFGSHNEIIFSYNSSQDCSCRCDGSGLAGYSMRIAGLRLFRPEHPEC